MQAVVCSAKVGTRDALLGCILDAVVDASGIVSGSCNSSLHCSRRSGQVRCGLGWDFRKLALNIDQCKFKAIIWNYIYTFSFSGSVFVCLLFHSTSFQQFLPCVLSFKLSDNSVTVQNCSTKLHDHKDLENRLLQLYQYILNHFVHILYFYIKFGCMERTYKYIWVPHNCMW